MFEQQLDSIARARIQRSKPEIEQSIARIAEGNPLAAEPDDDRLRAVLMNKARMSSSEARQVTKGIRAISGMTDQLPEAAPVSDGREAIWGDTIDFVGVAFLERGVTAARSVGRVAFRNGQGQGSGFMVSSRLFLTNNHVIPSAADARQYRIEFEYERDSAGQLRPATIYDVDPTVFFLTDGVAGLDFTLIALGNKVSGPASLPDFGWNALSDASDKHALGEVANIVQHPDGRFKEVVLRENRLVSRLDLALHYLADTQPGSSGSPVFNNDWEVIALHHWGGPWRERPPAGAPAGREINEGIRISAIVEHLRAQASRLSGAQRDLLTELLERESRGPVVAHRTVPLVASRSPICSIDEFGRASWQIPLEVSVRLPMADATPPARPPVVEPPPPDPAVVPPDSEAAVRPSTDYSRRSGYRADFIPGFNAPLPKLSSAQKEISARNSQAEDGDNPFELKYHHFSIVMNARRRLAFFGACNIDGATSKHVDRKKGTVSDLEPGDPHLESLSAEGAEASDSWYDDERLDPEDYAGGDTYEGQIVRGYPNPQSRGRMLRMFQRGHIVRRMDPAWGDKRMAKLADADTFHWTNCSPQVGFFNMGQANPWTPNSGGGKLWRAAENYVLRNAVVEEQKISCITGPVFRQNDRRFRGVRVPGQFWKVILWKDGGQPCSLALLLDQRPVIEVWPEAIGGQGESLGGEAFGDADELEAVEDFLSTIEEIEELTDLDFGSKVRNADIRRGEALVRVSNMSGIPTKPKRRRRGR